MTKAVDLLNEQDDILQEKILSAIYEYNVATGCFLNEIQVVYTEDETIDHLGTSMSTRFEEILYPLTDE